MKALLSLILPAVLLACAVPEARGQAEADLHRQLVGVYGQWREAMVSKHLGRWQATTSRRQQVVVKNRIYSERASFPAALFAVPVAPPTLAGLKAVQLKSKGGAAKAVYFGKVDFGVGGDPTDNLLVLNFVSEGGAWKYDGAEFVNLSALEDVRKQLQAEDYKYLHTPDFEPTAPGPVPIGLSGPVKYIAKTYVYAPGRDVTLQINKISRHNFRNTKDAELVIGGANDGLNEVQYLIKSMEGSTGTEPMTIRVYLMSEVQGVQPIKVFEYEVKEKEQAKGNGTMNFNVTPEVVAKLMGR